MDRTGPRTVMELGVVMMAAGFLLAPLTSEPWHLYMTIGVLVGAGSVCLGYSGQSLFLPNWFVRKRGLAVGVAFAGVGVGSITLLPWVQTLIEQAGWRAACWTLGLLILIVLAPINLVLRKRPQDLGLQPDGDTAPTASAARASNVVDRAWTSIDWTLARALRTKPFWWLALAYFTGLYAWYAVQIHQTKYLVEIGFSPSAAAWALGFVSLVGVPGQIWLGHVSDRIGREWVWSVGSAGFAICFLALIALQHTPSTALLYLMVFVQGFLGYGLTSVIGAVAIEIFEGKHFGSIYGTLTLTSLAGGAAGPWVTGVIHDQTGSYATAFAIGIVLSVVSIFSVWMAAPRKVRAVAGQVHKVKG
jgi:sugar phosphate permease